MREDLIRKGSVREAVTGFPRILKKIRKSPKCPRTGEESGNSDGRPHEQLSQSITDDVLQVLSAQGNVSKAKKAGGRLHMPSSPGCDVLAVNTE